MKISCTRILLAAGVVAGLLAGGWSAEAQGRRTQRVSAAQAEAEKQGCINNLKQIYTAIQAYQKDNKDLPTWLSDLVPKYLDDPNILVCPVAKRTGRTEAPPIGDPNLPCSYLFEFCLVPLGTNAPADPAATRREWKRKQMSMVGSVVPIVRCRMHTPVVLNLAFDGKIYESGTTWELLYTNLVNVDDLSPERMYALKEEKTATGYPKRDAKAKTNEIDLTDYYNARLSEAWLGGGNNDLASLPKGLQKFGGVEFDTRGVVQVAGNGPATQKFPMAVTNIKVNQKCRSLNFLAAAASGGTDEEGKQIGTYVVHYAVNQMRLEIPIRYGRELRNWHTAAIEPSGEVALTAVWTGANGASRAEGQSIRLFKTTWVNLAPDVEIESIDIIGGLSVAAPFVIAITAE